MNIFQVLWTFCQIASLGAVELWKYMMKDESHSGGQAGPGQRERAFQTFSQEETFRSHRSHSPGDMLPWYESMAGGPAIFRKTLFSSSLQGQLCLGHRGLSFVPRARPAHVHHRALAFAVLLPWESSSLRTCHDRSFLVLYVSVQRSNAQRGHLWRPAQKKQHPLPPVASIEWISFIALTLWILFLPIACYLEMVCSIAVCMDQGHSLIHCR